MPTSKSSHALKLVKCISLIASEIPRYENISAPVGCSDKATKTVLKGTETVLNQAVKMLLLLLPFLDGCLCLMTCIFVPLAYRLHVLSISLFALLSEHVWTCTFSTTMANTMYEYLCDEIKPLKLSQKNTINNTHDCSNCLTHSHCS